MSEVTVVVIPGEATVVQCNTDETVGEALAKAGVALDGESDVQVNGNDADASTPVKDGDDVTVAKRTKGNLDTVTVTKLPGDPVTVNIPAGSSATVLEVAELAGMKEEVVTDLLVTINGDDAELDDDVESGDDVVFTANTKGNK